MEAKPTLSLKLGVLLSFILMVTVNALANILPINGLNTGEISDSFPDLFAPAGLTFSIWGLIYLLLLLFTLYQIGLFREPLEHENNHILKITGQIFIVNALLNASWIFAWHYLIIPLSMIIMLGILISLILMTRSLHGQDLSSREKFFIELPIMVYLGWITVATIANVAALLVSVGWEGFGISEVTWTIATLYAGALIGSLVMAYTKSMAYGLVLVWAYAGIYIKHISPEGFNMAYPNIVTTVNITIGIFSIGIATVLFLKRRQRSIFKKM